FDVYLVTSHAMVEQAFRDNQSFSSDFTKIFTGQGRVDPKIEEIYATGPAQVPAILTSDEPDHTRLRTLAQKAFMATRVKRMSDLIATTITRLIDNFIERGECDFFHEFAVPLPINSVGAALGVDPAYYDKLYDWTFSLMRRDGQMGTPEEQIHDAEQ